MENHITCGLHMDCAPDDKKASHYMVDNRLTAHQSCHWQPQGHAPPCSDHHCSSQGACHGEIGYGSFNKIFGKQGTRTFCQYRKHWGQASIHFNCINTQTTSNTHASSEISQYERQCDAPVLVRPCIDYYHAMTVKFLQKPWHASWGQTPASAHVMKRRATPLPLRNPNTYPIN